MGVPVDRSKVAPFLVRVFTKRGQHNAADFRNRRVPDSELAVHCWMDTTLKELMALLLAQDGSLCNSHTRMNMRIVDRASHMDGNFVARPLGVVGTTLEWPDAVITLASAKFSIGDFIIVTTSDGPALPASAEPRGRSDKSGFGPTRGRDRERSSRYDPYSRGQRRSEADGRWARAEPAPR